MCWCISCVVAHNAKVIGHYHLQQEKKSREMNNTFLSNLFFSHWSTSDRYFLLFWIHKQSFAQKLTGLVTGPTDAPPDDTPWYLRYGARGLGIFGAFCKYLYHLVGSRTKLWKLLLTMTMMMIFSCHPVWILELLWSVDDKLFERIVGYPSNISRYFGDVNWGASLLHVLGSCTKISPSCWKPASLLSCWWLLYVSMHDPFNLLFIR